VGVSVSHKLVWSYIFNAPFIDLADRYKILCHKLSKPRRGVFVDVVVVDHAFHPWCRVVVTAVTRQAAVVGHCFSYRFM